MQYVLMAIPTDLVPAVANLIAGFEIHEDAPTPVGPSVDGQAPTPAGADASDAMINGWTEDLVRRAYKDSADPMRKVLAFIAQHADEEVTATQIADAIKAKYGWNTVAGMLGAFGRRSVNRYKRTEPMWELRWGPDDRALLKMPAAVAAVIETVAAE